MKRVQRTGAILLFLAAFGFWEHGLSLGVAQESGVVKPSPSRQAVVATGSNKEVARWIEQLGHDAYAMREAAAEKLLDAGSAAREPLLALVDDPNPETRAAARRLVALIDRSEFQRRLEAFAEDVDGRQGVTLPGWDQYRERAGSDGAARELFVEMQRNEGALLAAAFGVAARPASQMWEERLMRLVQWQVTGDNRNAAPPLGSCAAMLFLGSVEGIKVSDRGAMLVEHLIQRPPIRDSLQMGNYRPAVRQLVVGWVLDCPNQNEALLSRRIYLASMNELKEVLPLALAVAGGEGQYESVQPMTKAAAILLVGQFGGPEHIEHVEPLLDDSTICMPRVSQAPGLAANVQIRDVAMVVLATLTEQQPSDYGYINARMQAQKMYQLQTLHVASDELREQAALKWRQWKAANQGDKRSESN
ncbi:MAG TPA: hypothetical protein VJ828_03205 [Lacipirellulaceae bacterium]|nr:hypothetical protein [Lacipirellulaceae bacterium]